MDILLDTSIQIDRIFASRERKEKIKALLKGNRCFSSTYVLGEFNAGFLKNIYTMYSILEQESDLIEAEKRITERAFGKDKDKVQMLLRDLRSNYGDDLELIKLHLSAYSRRLRKRFSFGLEPKLLDETKCRRALAYVDNSGQSPVLKGISCRKTYDQCIICEFWTSHKKTLNGISSVLPSEKMRNSFNEIEKDVNNSKGNNCLSLGDVIISLESQRLNDRTVCTTNKKDFDPICNHIGVKVLSPNYSHKNV